MLLRKSAGRSKEEEEIETEANRIDNGHKQRRWDTVQGQQRVYKWKKERERFGLILSACSILSPSQLSNRTIHALLVCVCRVLVFVWPSRLIHSDHPHPIYSRSSFFLLTRLPAHSLSHRHSHTRSVSSFLHSENHHEITILFMMAREDEREWVNNWIAKQRNGSKCHRMLQARCPMTLCAYRHVWTWVCLCVCFGHFYFV